MHGAASNSNLLSRAYAAYFRSGAVDLPSNRSDEIVFGGKTYVVLRNVHGILAIYRLLKCGQLRRLRCYPAGLDRAIRALHRCFRRKKPKELDTVLSKGMETLLTLLRGRPPGLSLVWL
jgi:hypothetical protein